MAHLSERVSKRIAILRFTMIFGIVMLHTPLYAPLAETGPHVFDFIKATFQHAVFRASVPVLTFISGYLLFRAELDTRFNKLLVKKTRTILVPFVLFNLPVAVFVYFVQANQLIDHGFSKQLYPFDPAVWADALFGLFEAPINYPLNFLRDLYLLSLLAPLLGLLLRGYVRLGLAIVFLLFWFNLDGLFILRNDMPIVFYLGGMAAIQDWDLTKLDRFAAPFVALFLALCVAIVWFQIENRDYLRIVSPFLIWPAASLLADTRFGAWLAKLSKYSFLIFLAHGPLLLLAWLLYQRVATEVPYWVFWVVTPVIVVLLLALIQIYARRFIPHTVSVFLGGR